jgi:hypothetical protein
MWEFNLHPHQSSKDETKFYYISQQDKQWMYNVTWRRVRITIVATEKQELLHILSVYLQS